MSKAETEFSKCAFCGGIAALTKDHIPPRSWFPDVVDYELITVQTCRPCNAGWASDAEYMRSVLTIDHRTENNASRMKLQAKVIRGFARHRGGGPTKGIVASMREVDIRTAAGLYVGKTGSFVPEIDKLERVCGHIVRGLYRHHSGERLPDTHGVGAYIVAAFTPKDDEQRRSVDQLIQLALAGNYRKLGDVFEYDFRLVETTGSSAWVLQFFGSFAAIAVTLNKSEKPEHRNFW